jgi:hypothetical protein
LVEIVKVAVDLPAAIDTVAFTEAAEGLELDRVTT